MRRNFTPVILVAALVILLSGCGVTVQEEQQAQAIEKTASISGNIVDEKGKTLVAQIVITTEDRAFRINTDMLGRFFIELPLGEYRFEISKGSEYEIKTVDVEIADRKAKYLGSLPLIKLYQTDWVAGDLHQHSVYSYDGTDSPADILLSNMAMGLSFGVITDHNDIRANTEFLNTPFGDFIPFAGIEVTTNRGHYNAINFNNIIDPDISQEAADVKRIADEIHKETGAIAQINHPMRSDFAFEDWELISEFDTMEIWNGKSMPPYVPDEPNALALQKWFELLNQGVYIPATAGSDNHDISGNKMFALDTFKSDDERYFMSSMYSGMPRNYVYAPGKDAESILNAIMNGHGFLTNNPLAFLDIDGAIPGESIEAGERQISIKIQSNRRLTRFRILKNAEILYEENLSSKQAEASYPANLEKGDWIVLEVCGEKGDYAITNPVFIN